MKIEKLEWRNIFSYGNRIVELDFNGDGMLWQLSGKSGAGKSSFLSIPKLLFFGKTDASDGKPVKVGDISNRVNKHGWIRGTVRKGDDLFIIERTFSPQSLTVYKNGENIDKAGLKNVQSVIDSEILDGLPYGIFSNIMTLSLNSFKSFISMSPSDKRSIIDKIFSLELINSIYEIVKKDMRDLGNLINSGNSQINSLNQTISTSLNELKHLEESNVSGIDERILSLNERISKVSDLYISQCDIYSKACDSYNELIQKVNSIRQEVSSAEFDLRGIDEKLSLFNQDKCPTCGTRFDGSEFTELKEKLNSMHAEKSEYISGLKSKLDEMVSEQSSSYSIIMEYKSNVDKVFAKHAELTAELKSLESIKNAPSEYDSIKKIIASAEDSRKRAEDSVNDATDKMKLLSVMERMYSADGIKQSMMENYVPALNEEIGNALDFLGFPYTLEFDVSFNPHLKYLGRDIEPQGLSTGEHKKVDLAVLCAILRMMKMKYPQINLVCLDETLSSLDYESSSDIIKYLKDISEKMSLNIFIVSHTQLDESLFDRHIHVEKVSGFSEINFC